MKKLTVILSFILFSGIAVLAQQGDYIIGAWYSVDQKSIITFIKEQPGGEYSGKLTWIKVKEKEGLLGKTMVRNLEFSEKENLYSGEIFLPKYDTYRECEMMVKGDKLIIRPKSAFTSKTIEWTRKKD